MNVLCPPASGETSCTTPLSTPPQRPRYARNINSYVSSPPSSPLSSRGTSTGSETDTEDGFPLTPDSKHSGGAYRHITGTSPGAQSSRAKHRSESHHHSFHPYRPPPCFQDVHAFDSLVGRPASDSDNRAQALDSNTSDLFSSYLDELSPASCRFIVHYKEAVRERQRMRLFMTYWELEETTRLRTLLTSLYGEEDLEFHKIEKETRGLLKALVAKQSLSRTAADLDFLTATRQKNKMSLRETDAWLDLLKDRTTQTRMHPIKSSADDLNNTSNCVGSGPNATHA
ncbi:hypothetical protein C8R48DRAFT_772838 [Suillus tomentosus]|nr:hypothetical protein C8R48DRAFT_772838 [Suillus tomentosus]